MKNNLIFLFDNNSLINLKYNKKESVLLSLNPNLIFNNEHSVLNLQDFIESSDLEKNYLDSTEICIRSIGKNPRIRIDARWRLSWTEVGIVDCPSQSIGERMRTI